MLNKNAVVCENCGEKVEKPPVQKWYGKSITVILFLIFFFPIGLFLMWKYSTWDISAKVTITVIWGVILIIGILGEEEPNNIETSVQPASSVTASESKNSKPSVEVIEIDYRTLYDEYEENSIAADEKYKGKTLKITGEIDEISKDIFHKPFITIQLEYLKNIRLNFKNTEEPKLAQLSKGQTITVTGKCKGMTILDVGLEKCELVD